MDKALKHLCNGILSFRFYSKSLETSGCSTCGIIGKNFDFIVI